MVTGGINHAQYRTDRSTGIILGAERYFGRYRAAYFFRGGSAENAGGAAGHRLSFTEYVTDQTSYTVAINAGREAESVGNGRLIRTDVKGISVGGRLGVSRQGALTAELGYYEQGALYTRRSISFGYRHVF